MIIILCLFNNKTIGLVLCIYAVFLNFIFLVIHFIVYYKNAGDGLEV